MNNIFLILEHSQQLHFPASLWAVGAMIHAVFASPVILSELNLLLRMHKVELVFRPC